VAVDGAGNVVVADCGNHRIVIFTAAGEVVRAFGREGSGAGELKGPTGVPVDGAGNVVVADVVVADAGNSRIVIFTAAGEVVRAFGRRGSELQSPMGVAVDGAGNVMVADSSNSRIVLF
jgi:tripartite motif-containing protein 71